MISGHTFSSKRIRDIAHQLSNKKLRPKFLEMWGSILQSNKELSSLVDFSKRFYYYHLIESNAIIRAQPSSSSRDFAEFLTHWNNFYFSREILKFDPSLTYNNFNLTTIDYNLTIGNHVLYCVLNEVGLSKEILWVGQLDADAEVFVFDKVKQSLRSDFWPTNASPKKALSNNPRDRIETAFTLLAHWVDYHNVPSSNVLDQLAKLYEAKPSLLSVVFYVWFLSASQIPFVKFSDLVLLAFVAVNGQHASFNFGIEFETNYESFVLYKALSSTLSSIFRFNILMGFEDSVTILRSINFTFYSFLTSQCSFSESPSVSDCLNLVSDMIELPLDEHEVRLVHFIMSVVNSDETTAIPDIDLGNVSTWDDTYYYEIQELKSPILSDFDVVSLNVAKINVSQPKSKPVGTLNPFDLLMDD
ncbi:hypothetical protein GEMRC1_003414 [Eukaryota sp. GEM-RC1]